jgi:hypothetical protein
VQFFCCRLYVWEDIVLCNGLSLAATADILMHVDFSSKQIYLHPSVSSTREFNLCSGCNSVSWHSQLWLLYILTEHQGSSYCCDGKPEAVKRVSGPLSGPDILFTTCGPAVPIMGVEGGLQHVKCYESVLAVLRVERLSSYVCNTSHLKCRGDCNSPFVPRSVHRILYRVPARRYGSSQSLVGDLSAYKSLKCRFIKYTALWSDTFTAALNVW